MDKIRKKQIRVFKDNGFSIDIVANLVKLKFLDVTLNLRNGSYRPSKKSNDEPKHINVYITLMNHQLKSNISNQIFHEWKHQYEDILSKSGFKTNFLKTHHNLPTEE